MAQEGLIHKLGSPHKSLDMLWSHLDYKKPLKLSGYAHAKAEGDLFIACHLSGAVWTYRPADLDKIEPDDKAVWDDTTIYYEVDMSTMSPDKIQDKINRYIRVPQRFHVIFVIGSNQTHPDHRKAEIENQADMILELITNAKRGHQFLITLLDWATVDPTKMIVSPLDTSKHFSLNELQ